MIQNLEQDNVGRIWFSSWGLWPAYGHIQSNSLLMYDGIRVHSFSLEDEERVFFENNIH